MTENELREVLGEELFDRLSQDDKELLLNTAGKFNFNIEGEMKNQPRRAGSKAPAFHLQITGLALL